MKKIMLADYRWRGHRLGFTLKVLESIKNSYENIDVVLHLPVDAYKSSEWEANTADLSYSVNTKKYFSYKYHGVPSSLNMWVNSVIRDAKDVDTDLVIFIWGDKLIDYVAQLHNIPDVYMITGRFPKPDVVQRKIISKNIHIFQLCSLFDNRINQDHLDSKYSYIVDPIFLPKLQLTYGQAKQQLGLNDNHKFAVLIGDISERKIADKIVDNWGRIYSETGLVLLVVGVTDKSIYGVEQKISAQIKSYPGSIVRVERFINDVDFFNYINASDLVLCTFQPNTYAPSNVFNIATYLQKPILIQGNEYLSEIASNKESIIFTNVNKDKVSDEINELITKFHPKDSSIYDIDFDHFTRTLLRERAF